MTVALVGPLTAARAALRHHFGHPDFRPGQREVVAHVLAGRDVLGVLPTGAGKSVCFQVPAMVLGGWTAVVSPLLSLMADQVAAARARGIAAASLTSVESAEAQAATLAALRAGALRLLYLSPERLEHAAATLVRLGGPPALLAVDEAHCIAEWGPDFRPAFRRLGIARRRLGDPPVAALTGSATPLVREDIARVLGLGRRGRSLAVHVGSFDRPNLRFAVTTVDGPAARLATLRTLVDRRRLEGTAIVYAPTRNVVEGIAHALRRDGHRVAPYHAGLAPGERRTILARFLADDVHVVVATCAFGMGIDKPTVRLVVHWTLPPTPEAYYQEAGRAGRDGQPARCILLHKRGDGVVHRRMLDVTFPAPARVERLWRDAAALAREPANLRDAVERLRRELRPEEGRVDWGPVRVRRRAAQERLGMMERYAGGRACRRRMLLGYFGERAGACAGCDRCARGS